MNLALESRFVSFVLRVSDARKFEADEDEEDLEFVDNTGGEFGFQSTGDEDDG